MPFSGNTYTSPSGATNQVPGNTIQSATWNAIFTDLAAAVNTLAARTNVAQCQLTLSGSNLLLSPYGGNTITINNTSQTIPDAGVTLATTGSTSIFYYIYAYMSGSTMTLLPSTTAPVAQTGSGLKVMTGDVTKTLVGAAATTASNAWSDTDGNLLTLSYFNRRPKKSKTSFTTSRAVTSTTVAEVNTELRNNFITWNDSEVRIACMAPMADSSTGQVTAAIAVDSSTTADQQVGIYYSNAASTNTASIVDDKSALTEAAVHYATLLVASSAGTLTLNTTTGLYVTIYG